MKAFELALPGTLREAVAELANKDGSPARILAGGQDLLTEMKEHLAEPERLVSLSRLSSLKKIQQEENQIVIGAMVTLAQLSEDPLINAHPGLAGLVQAALSVGSPQIRSQATVGGNLNQRPRCPYYRNEQFVCLKKGGNECFSYYGRNKYNAILGGGPSYIVHPSDLAPMLIALQATVSILAEGGSQLIPLEDFFVLPAEGDILTETRLQQGQILTEVRVTIPPAARRSAYRKFRERDSYDFALSAVAAVHEADDAGVTRHLRLVLGGVAPVPWHLAETEKKLLGRRLDEDAIVLAQDHGLVDAQPLSENAYKIPLTKGLIAEALEAFQ